MTRGSGPGPLRGFTPSPRSVHPLQVVKGAGDACGRLTQHQIATMTGSVREVVQRALKALEKDGAIRLERARVVVLDPSALERWSESTGSPAT